MAKLFTCGRCSARVDGGWSHDAYGFICPACRDEMVRAGIAAAFIKERYPRRFRRLIADLERMAQ